MTEGPLETPRQSAVLKSAGPRRQEAQNQDQPRRAMSFRDVVLFYVVTGISLRWIPTAAAAGPSAVTIWIIAWLVFFIPLVFSVLELSSRHPEEGGLYVWSKSALGNFAGFMAAWTYWTSNLPYFPAVLYFAAANALFIQAGGGHHLSASRTYFILFALLGLALPTCLNILGLNLGKWLNNVGAVATWLPVLIVIVMGMIAWHHFGPASHFTRQTLVPSLRLKDIIFCSTITYALGGCETASFMGGEIENARQTIPRALIVGGVLVTVAYIVGTVSVLLALPRAEINDLEGLMQAIISTANRVGFQSIIPLAAILITISNLGSAGAYLAATARLPFVAGIDRFLPAAFGRLHPKWRTPYVALLTQAACGVLFIFLGQAGTSVRGAYDVLISLGVMTYFIPYTFVFASMLRLQREQAGPEVIRVPGGRPVALALAAVGLASSVITIALSLVPSPGEPNKGLAVAKVILGTVLLLGVGACIYQIGGRGVRRGMTGH
jgi:glutamate:GABA antiporter